MHAARSRWGVAPHSSCKISPRITGPSLSRSQQHQQRLAGSTSSNAYAEGNGTGPKRQRLFDNVDGDGVGMRGNVLAAPVTSTTGNAHDPDAATNMADAANRSQLGVQEAATGSDDIQQGSSLNSRLASEGESTSDSSSDSNSTSAWSQSSNGSTSAGRSSNSSNGRTIAGNGSSNSGMDPVPIWETGWGVPEPVLDWGEQMPDRLPPEYSEAEWRTVAESSASATDAGGGHSNSRWAGSGFSGAWQPEYNTWQPEEQPMPDQWQQWSDSSFAREGHATSAYRQASDVTLLAPWDAEAVLPVTPSSEQAQYYTPATVPERVVQVLGSIGACVALSKTAALAGPALLYPVWGPWIRAGVRNLELYSKQLKSLGLWRAEVLAISITSIPYAANYSGATDTITITVGDSWPEGARTQLTFAYFPGAEDIVVGEPAELLVISTDSVFQQFKVVREVYLPQTGIWLSEYPFLNRRVFLDISLAVERSRQAPPNNSASDPGVQAGYYDVL